MKAIQVNNVKAVPWGTGQMEGIQVNNVKADPWEAGQMHRHSLHRMALSAIKAWLCFGCC